ncbi:hypothetical protein AAEX28_02925 [Lentisphaerota bacterium WC36G]|nr:hypothetical protein LJT99_05805 [Lentisphaerae bacterium WC36]
MKKILFLTLCCFVTSCSSIVDSHKQKKELLRDFEKAKSKSTTKKITDKLKSTKNSGDQLMWNLEAGTNYFINYDYKNSLVQFSTAEKIINDFDSRAVINARGISSEIAVSVTNLNALPYDGFGYDRIMVNCYKALTYFALNNTEAGLVELRRLRNTQKIIEKRHQSQILADRKKIEKENLQLKKTVSEDSINSSDNMKNIAIDLKKNCEKKYGNLMNPFATYLSAIGYLYENNSSEALVDFKNLYRIEKNNDYVNSHYVELLNKFGEKIPKDLEKYNLQKPDDKKVYIIFANGRSAAYEQQKFWLILPYVGYTGLAYPKIIFYNNNIKGAVIKTDSQQYKLQKIASMDAVIAEEYSDRLAPMITRIAVSYVVKELASYTAVEATRNKDNSNDLGVIATYIGTGIYKYIFNTADTRSWELLPKEYLIANIPCPKSKKLELQPLPTGDKLNIKIDNINAKIIIVYLRSNSNQIISSNVFYLK